jgi:hypothetical protein
MLRATDDLIELRHWTEERGGRPCRRPDGTLTLCFAADLASALPVGWDEFETTFVRSRQVVVCDDAPGSTRCFIGTSAEARAYIAAANPRYSGFAGPTP